MIREYIIYQILILLSNPLIPPAERLAIEPLLEKMKEDDLEALRVSLQKKIASASDSELLFHQILEAADGVVAESAQAAAKFAQQHPLYNLTLQDAQAAVRDHVVEYIDRGVNLEREVELYYNSQREQVLQDGDDQGGVSTYGEILQSLAKELNESTYLIERAQGEALPLGKLLAQYDNAHPPLKGKRGGFEQLSFAQELNLKTPAEKSLVSKVLAFYDYLKFAGAEFLEVPLSVLLADKTSVPSPSAPVVPPTAAKRSPEPVVNTPVPPPVTQPAPRPAPAVSTPAPAQVPSVMKSTGPVLMFDTRDEQEVDKFRSLPFVASGALERDLRSLADRVITQNKFNFKDESAKRRFVNLFVSRLKDVRSLVDMREVLLKPVTSGGLGLPLEKAEQVIVIVERAKKDFASAPKSTTPPAPIPADLPAVVQPAPAALPPGPEVSAPKQESVPPSPAKPTAPEPTPVPPPTPTNEDWRSEMLEEIARLAAETPPTQAASPAAPAAPERPQLSDVKAPPRTLGPLEELKTLTLVDFRRLDSSPVGALAHLRAKIDLIGEASVSRHLEAVRAWQASPLYQLYLTMGRECIEQGRVVAQVATDRQGRGEPTLSEAEFDAIVDFNTKLRF